MSLFSKLILVSIIFLFQKKQYQYILICTSKNCTPCVSVADDFFNKNKIKYKLINLYSNNADKQFTDELIKDYCNKSKDRLFKKIKNTFSLGKKQFKSSDNGPLLIKYSINDTVIYNASDIDDINND